MESQALSLGLKSTQIICHGLPIRPSFCISSGSRTFLRGKLGMEKDALTVMIIGGGEGMGKITEIADALSTRYVCDNIANPLLPLKRLSSSHQLVIICGNNQSLKANLSSKNWPLKVHVKVLYTNLNKA